MISESCYVPAKHLYASSGASKIADIYGYSRGAEIDPRLFQGGLWGNSAGAALLAGLSAGQLNETEDFIVNVATDRDVVNPQRFWRNGKKVVDLDLYMNAMRERLDPSRLFAKGNAPLHIGVVHGLTGQHAYRRAKADTIFELLRATHTVGWKITDNSLLEGENYFDGGYGELLPLHAIREAIATDIRLVVLSTRPIQPQHVSIERIIVGIIYNISALLRKSGIIRTSPNAVLKAYKKALNEGEEAREILAKLNDGLDRKIFVSAPSVVKVRSFENAKENVHRAIDAGYERGRADRSRLQDFLQL